MDRTVERLVRQIARARRLGDEAGEIIAFARLEALVRLPGFYRAFDRALTIVGR